MIQQLGRQVIIGTLVLLIRIYRNTLSLLFAPSCRYTPTCSQYAIDALHQYGVLTGLNRMVRRILRCHPFSKHTHYDPA